VYDNDDVLSEQQIVAAAMLHALEEVRSANPAAFLNPCFGDCENPVDDLLRIPGLLLDKADPYCNTSAWDMV